MLRKLACRILTARNGAVVHHPAIRNLVQSRMIQISAARRDLMEFFDEKKNWGEVEVKVGRSWKVDELRLKSNTDLHKLWYILLKEKNMLLTMEYDAKQQCRMFPNPERIDKVEESMENLETVVRERNKAYFMLETGTSGERTGEEFENWLGLQEYRQHKEYPVPKEENQEWYKEQEEIPKSSDKEKAHYFTHLRVKQKQTARKLMSRYLHEIQETLKKFPNLDKVALRAKYSDVPDGKFSKAIERVESRNWDNSVIPYEVKKWRGQHVRPINMTWRKKYNQ